MIDMCHLLHILMHNIEDMKGFLDIPDEIKFPFCSVILNKTLDLFALSSVLLSVCCFNLRTICFFCIFKYILWTIM